METIYLASGAVLSVVDIVLWRHLTSSGKLAGDAVCTGYVGRNGRRFGRPFWNGTASAARSLSSTARSAVRMGRCMFTRSTLPLTRTISLTTRRLVRRITQGGII